MPPELPARFRGSFLPAVAQRPWLQAALVALPVLHLLLGLPTKEFTYDLDGTKAAFYQGHAYAWPIPRPSRIWQIPGDSTGAPWVSTLRLYENGLPVGRAHALYVDIASKRGGAYSHWDDTLVFTPRDNSDPRVNGHTYYATATATLTGPLQSLLITAIYLAGAIGILGHVLGRMGTQSISIRAALRTMRSRIVTALPGRTFREVISVGLVLMPFAVGISLFVAPYVSGDSQVLAASEPNDFVIPHFGPLYPFFARIVNSVVEIALWPIHWQPPTGIYKPHYSGISLRVLMLLQHAITILSVSYFAVTIAKSHWIRVVVAALLYFQPYMLVFTHAVLSEGLSFAVLCAAMAELVRFSRFDGAHRAALVRFYLLIGVAALTKHIFIVFAGAPLGCVLITLLSRDARKQLVQHRMLVEAKYLLAGLVGVIVATHLANNEVMRLLNIEPRSMVGRAFVHRLSPEPIQGEILFFRSDAERIAVVEELKTGTNDETLRQVIDIVARTPDPWVAPWNAVERFVVTECLAEVCQQHPWAATDELLNSVARHAIISSDLRLWRDVGFRTLKLVSPLLIGAKFVFEPPPRLNESVVGLSSSTLDSYSIQMARDLRAVIIADNIFAEFAGLLGLVAVAVVTLRMKRILVIPTTILASALIYALAVSAVTLYASRYGVVVGLLGVLATVAAVVDLQTQRRYAATLRDVALTGAAVASDWERENDLRGGKAQQNPEKMWSGEP